jgi:lipopolysaccharide export system permease protein
MVFALFTFVVYYNLINLGQSWITGGRADFTGFMLALHGGGLLLGLLWLAKRHHNWTLRSLLRKRPTETVA